jgi:hypothetical protein
MKYWTDVYRIAEQALCLTCIDSMHFFLSQEGARQIKIKVKKEIQRGKIIAGYAMFEIGIDEKAFEYKFLVSWGDQKFEDINFWMTTVKENYITCKNKNFLNGLYEFNREMNNTWEHLSKWIVHNTDYKEIIVNKDTDLKEVILGDYFNKDFEYTQLSILLDEEKFKDKVKKI